MSMGRLDSQQQEDRQRALVPNQIAIAKRVFSPDVDEVLFAKRILELTLVGHPVVGALRVRTVATKDRRSHDFTCKTTDGKYEPEVVLDFDYTVLMPRLESEA